MLINVLELIAHKIQNPLHSMGLNLEALKLRASKSSQNKPETLLRHIDIIQKEQERLKNIIHAGIEYLKPGGQMKRRIQVDRLIAEIRVFTTPYASEKKIDLLFEMDGKLSPFKANADEIQQALVYLIQNAIEAVSKNGTVKVVVHEKKQELFFEIHDNGIGVSKDDAKKILNLYYTTKQGHVGMGLPLAKKYIEENRGKITMQSKASKGTIVMVSFENKGQTGV